VTGGTGLRRFVTAPPGTPPAARKTGAQAAGPAETAASRAAAASAALAGAAPADAALADAALADAAPADAALADSALAGTAPADAAPIASAWADAAPAAAATEKCEMCATEIAAEHGHLADLTASSLVCACRACYLLFTQRQAAQGRYRAVPDRYLTDQDRPLTAAQWDQLEVPVGLAFFLRSSDRGEVTGFYPSPAGATECILNLAAWERLATEYPLLAAAEPDLEAVLISRTDSGVDYFLVPIDACYELAGRMRLHWRGFDGGAEAKQSIADFLAMVSARARPLPPEPADG
jgi:hypothetical protein